MTNFDKKSINIFTMNGILFSSLQIIKVNDGILENWYGTSSTVFEVHAIRNGRF